MRVRNWPLAAIIVAASTTLPVSAASASPEPFPDKDAAARAGDPAGTGPSAAAPIVGVLDGKALSFDRIKARVGALNCVTLAPEDGGETRCYRSSRELLDASNRQATQANATIAASCGVNIQVHYQWGSFNGDNYAFAGRTYWQNLPAYMDNNTSSYDIGSTGGHMAENYNGGGYWYPGPTTSPCDHWSITYGSYPTWDNRISSGWRSL